jgi:uncharacterized phage-associated protein
MEAKKIDIIDLSIFLIYHFLKNEISLNPLKLQKILYYIQAWHLVYFSNQDLFDDEPEAWVNGPVYRKVYNEFKGWRLYDSFHVRNDKDIGEEYKKSLEKLSICEEQLEFLASILNHYGTMSHDKLVYLTHVEEPWNNARKGIEPFTYSDQKISKKDMFNYYSKLISDKK